MSRANIRSGRPNLPPVGVMDDDTSRILGYPLLRRSEQTKTINVSVVDVNDSTASTSSHTLYATTSTKGDHEQRRIAYARYLQTVFLDAKHSAYLKRHRKQMTDQLKRLNAVRDHKMKTVLDLQNRDDAAKTTSAIREAREYLLDPRLINISQELSEVMTPGCDALGACISRTMQTLSVDDDLVLTEDGGQCGEKSLSQVMNESHAILSSTPDVSIIEAFNKEGQLIQDISAVVLEQTDSLFEMAQKMGELSQEIDTECSLRIFNNGLIGT